MDLVQVGHHWSELVLLWKGSDVNLGLLWAFIPADERMKGSLGILKYHGSWWLFDSPPCCINKNQRIRCTVFGPRFELLNP